MLEFILRYIMLSSANRRILDLMFSLMSLMYSKKSIGPRTEPCGTPDVTYVVSDRAPLTETRCLLFDRTDVIQLCVLAVIPYEVSLDRRRLCGTLSKALAKSRRIASVCVLLSILLCYNIIAHTNLVDVQLNNTMMTITGAVRCTMTEWLPVLSNIAPADIPREVATSTTILRARGKPELPLLTDIDFHPRPRLKSRRPIWSNLPDEAQTIQHLWRTRWQNQIVYVPNKPLINDPTIQLPVPIRRGTIPQQHA